MDVTARVSALEQEVSVLKNEIKAILHEVRVAVLAVDNPLAPVAAVAASPLPPVTTPPLAPAEIQPAEQSFVRAQQPISNDRLERGSSSFRPDATPHLAVEASQATVAKRWSRHELATFMEWVQNVTQRFGRKELAVMLGMSRHGGLISVQLEETLLKLGTTLDLVDSKPSSLSDFLLSLRELEAVLAPEEFGAVSQRYVA